MRAEERESITQLYRALKRAVREIQEFSGKSYKWAAKPYLKTLRMARTRIEAVRAKVGQRNKNKADDLAVLTWGRLNRKIDGWQHMTVRELAKAMNEAGIEPPTKSGWNGTPCFDFVSDSEH